jgi:hypothetical protein
MADHHRLEADLAQAEGLADSADLAPQLVRLASVGAQAAGCEADARKKGDAPRRARHIFALVVV